MKDGVDAKHTTKLSTKDMVKKTSIKEKINDKKKSQKDKKKSQKDKKKSQKHLVLRKNIVSSSDSESSDPDSIPVSDPGVNASEISSDGNDSEISFDDNDSEMASQQSDDVTGSQASTSTTQDSTPPPIKHKSLPQSDPKP